MDELDENLIEKVILGFDKGKIEDLFDFVCSYKGQSLNRHLEEIYDCLGWSYDC